MLVFMCTLYITGEQRQPEAEDQHQHYLQLMDLDNTDLVPTVEPFECPVCIVHHEAGEGVVLRECLHMFCRYKFIFTSVTVTGINVWHFILSTFFIPVYNV
jgi:hypothetical protein